MRTLFLSLLVLACNQPIPAERSAYIGEWRSPNMLIAIEADGELHYRRVEGNSRTSIDAPLQSFQGDDFVSGVWFVRTTFKVSRPPHLEDGVWKMTVDGVELTRRQ